MDIYKIKFTRLENEIFRFLCIKSGISLNQRTIARMLKVSPTAVSNSLPALEKEGLIKIKKQPNFNLLSIEFNRENQNAINLKRVENIKMIYDSGLAEFLRENFPGCSVILFGSYSRGEDSITEDFDGHKSDIDMAVIGTKGKEIDLTKFSKLFEREITINFYSSFKDIHKNLKNNILSGILFNGGVDL